MEVSKDKKESIGDYVDNYIITPNYEHPRFKELMTEFQKQEHRFEIDTCEFKYNGKSFFLGDSPKKIVGVFGQPDGGKIVTLDDNSIIYKYNLLKLLIGFNKKNLKVDTYSINMSDHEGHADTPYSIILFRKVPYHLDMKLNDYMKLSDLNHDKLKRISRSFFMIQKECPPDKNALIYTSIGSTAFYKSMGSGHLTYSGDFNPEESSPIRNLSIYFKTLEDFKK